MALNLDNVVKTYGTKELPTHALRGVSLTIKDGEFVVILGPSGSGKSTLLNVMGGLDVVTDGDIVIDDYTITQMNQKALTAFRREHVGFIFQQYNLLQTLTVKENVEIGARLVNNAAKSDDLISRVGLTDHAHKYPYQLSGGEQQRVAIARALVKNPKLLFCDEPTGALDEETAKEILALLQDLNTSLKTTIILITHNASIGQIADRVIKMNSGEISDIITNSEKRKAQEIHWG